MVYTLSGSVRCIKPPILAIKECVRGGGLKKKQQEE
jgi:hypothetical protein